MVADEGMWMPQQVPQLSAELRKLGVQLDPARLADLTGDPLGAVISLGGSCTASFVSPDGLVVTNYHCAFGSLQHNSTAERDLLREGFLARTREQELPAAPGTKVWVTTKIEDVTARVNGGMKADVSDVERARLIDRREKELVAECEKPGGLRCSVAAFFEGSQYLRTTRQEFTDVRIVYAPSGRIGEYGGEIDNFEWPRHTGDFAFYRVYAGGRPYRPQHWLKLATGDLDEGEVVMVAGYPGRTFRHRTADEVRNYKEFVYPVNVRYLADVMALLEEAGKNNRDVQIRNASRIRGLANSMKNYSSVLEGFTKDRIVESRVEREAKIRATDGAAALMDEIARVNATKLRTRERDLILDWLVGRGSPMLAQSMAVARVATERAKRDIDRAAKYQEREWPGLKNASDRAQRVIDRNSDRAVVRYFLLEAAKLPAEQRIKPVDDAVAAAGGVEQLLERLYGSTQIGVQEERAKMFGESIAQLRARGDAMVELALSLVPLLDAREERELAWQGAMARLRPAYFDVLRKASSGALYPDANSTLRLTFGRIEGYRPKDATWYAPQTTLRGLVEKETGKEPFESPKTLLAAAADPAKTRVHVDPELKDVPVNFLSTCDTTGGNSGSPTLNAKGELVGLLFDGNYESIDSDFVFNPADTRSIHVDAKYMLWVMDVVDGAHELMKELGAK